MTPIDLTITVLCERIAPRATVTARTSRDGAFFGGSADVRAADGPLGMLIATFGALAWSIDEYVRRHVLGLPHCMSRDPRAQPGDALRAASHAPMVDDVAAPASLASSAHSSNAGPSPAANARRPRAAQAAPRGGSTSGDVAPRAAVPATLELTAPSAAVRR